MSFWFHKNNFLNQSRYEVAPLRSFKNRFFNNDSFSYMSTRKSINSNEDKAKRSIVIIPDEVKNILRILFEQIKSDNKVILIEYFDVIISNKAKFEVFMNEHQTNKFMDEMNHMCHNHPSQTYWRWDDFLIYMKKDTCLCFNSEYILPSKDIVSKSEFAQLLTEKGIIDTPKVSNVNKSPMYTAGIETPIKLSPSHVNVSATPKTARYKDIFDKLKEETALLRSSNNKIELEVTARIEKLVTGIDKALNRPELIDWDLNDDDTNYRNENRVAKLIDARYIEVSEDDISNMKRIFNSRPSDEILTNKFNIEMSISKIQCLRPRTWLNDEVINFYMNLLQERDKELCKIYPDRKPSHYFSSYFMERLIITDRKYNYNNIKRWSKKFDIFTMNKIYFPINISNSHWTLAIILMQAKEIHYYDSMNGSGMNYLNSLLKYVIDEGKEKKNIIINEKEWKLISQLDSTPQQLNGYDCGMFAMICADFHTDSLPIDNNSYNQDKMSHFRVKVINDILRGSLTYPIE